MAEQHGKALVPQIRFAGFTDPWEQRKLEDYVVVSTAKNVDGRFNKEDVLSVSGEYGIVNQIAFQGRSFAGSSVLNYGIVNTGDIVYTKSPLNSNPYGIIKVNKGIPGIVSTLYAVYRPQDNVHTNFIQVYFEQHERMNNYMHPLVNKGAKNDMKVTAENALKGVVTFPSREEQVIISEFFDRLDSLITLHQRKYDKLCVLKKSMLDKMFPKGGSLYPEIRFAGFTDPWEQRKLGEVATFGGGHTPSMSDSDNYEGGNVLWVTSQDVKSHYLDGTTTQITEKGAKELTLYPAGSLVMVTRSGILRHTLPVAELRKPSTVNQDIRVILPQENYYGQWLLQFFISRNKELLLEFGKTGTTVESVDFSKMRDMVLLTPSLPEQQQIGRYFARLDNLITLHQRKLELLRNIKKSMLDKMFV
ncbi:restriction endonuclease subunit S [Bifidobacterium adolescentis]|nr:restriction endonuclease subunit S [Bifidobacterium adolescentis]KAB5873130.1 restriction endonuclease subunit S [Bifidobacterium adolescentis]